MTPERMEEIRTALKEGGWESKVVQWIEECFESIENANDRITELEAELEEKKQ